MAGRKREYWNPLLMTYPDSRKVNAVSIGAETLYTRLLAMADDNANIEGSVTLLVCKLFAKRLENKQITFEDIQRWREELINIKLLELYTVDGKEYLHIVNCKKCKRKDLSDYVTCPDISESDQKSQSPKPKHKTSQNPSRKPKQKPKPKSNNSGTDNDTQSEFEKARKLYPGSKRGLKTEFEDFKKKHKDWKEALPLLVPAIEAQINHKDHLKAANQFCPQWKNFKTWINQRCWEEEQPNNQSDTYKALGKSSKSLEDAEQLEKELGI